MIKTTLKLKGSMAIEALISMTIVIVTCTIMLGTLLTIYIDERLDWSLLQTREEMSMYAMPFMGHERFIQKELNTLILESITNQTINKQWDKYSISKFVKTESKTALTFSRYGFAEYHLSYNYAFPTVFASKSKVMPIAAAVITDGINFKEIIVYVTTYGEKFHKSECFHLRKSKFAITIDLAKEKGYEPCKNCHKDFPIEM